MTAEEHRKYNAAWRAAHYKKQLEYSRAYRAAHREKDREGCRKYYAAHRKECCEYSRKYRAAHREKQCEYERVYRATHRQKLYETTRKYRAAHPEHFAAKKVVECAVQDGTLVRAPVCMDCGKWYLTEAHHPNYSKPLDVIWLCRECHRLAHRKVA